ncbi:regulator of telomere elongation helicase 1 homolog [Selaginella moellendorffii]|uniref:regulator of telomere elongation helicase 1 homolog n=1 Tax=Selaginella moellendorffii TaxID=88036 RepID=UPI000D1C240D|nr:regulator of telomere elongation helicase 1 homolog [Selaginella moellendorffii]|eukprot:XP_024539869.1 regulator of telomere elongation helicase 1 homolog [Selaginella moellendorffii]
MPSYKLKGVDVRFPYDAYDCQLVYMESVIAALQKGQNALLESPTGTGKTLCLLCATLAWRESLAPPDRGRRMSASSQSSDLDPTSSQEANKLPTVIYASRTHSQLQQVIHELKATSYRPKMVALGSREQLCIEKDVQKLRGRAQNNACRTSCKARKCYHHTRVNEYLKNNPELGNEPIDIEDLVRIGRTHGPCPYFLSRELHGSVDMIFVPYNYLIDKENRKSLTGIRWENSVIIFDEAHNLEGVCADAASFDLPTTTLSACISEAGQCVELATLQRSISNNADKSGDSENFALLKALLLELSKKIDDISFDSEELGFTRPGSYIYDFLSELKITWETSTMLTDTIDSAISLLQEDSSAPSGKPKTSTCKLELLRDAFRTIFRGKDSTHATCYRVHVQNSYRRAEDKGLSKGDKKSRTFSWWCFNPGIAMEEFSKLGVRTIVLTSGTLSPLESFAIELKLPFDVRLENPHVIGANQIWVGVVSSGPSGRALNSSYRTRDSPEYKNDLGNTIVNFARIVPNGLLVFFPSYYLLNSCVDSWQTPNQVNGHTLWERICKHKQPVVEPKESALFNQAHEDFLAKVKDSTGTGAVFFAVCRGKVSEGLDFADETGRAVIVTGMPFAMKTDPKVRLKRQYLDEEGRRTKTSTRKVLTGEDWYVQQASRAVNQAVGRVIRHKNDYGAIILCDERFAQAGAQSQLSLWLRPHVKLYSKFGDAAFTLTRFFKDKKPQPRTMSKVQQNTSSLPDLPCLNKVHPLQSEPRQSAVTTFIASAVAVHENVFLERKTIDPLSKIFGASTNEQQPLSVVLAAKRNQQLCSAAIKPANRAFGSRPELVKNAISVSKQRGSDEGTDRVSSPIEACEAGTVGTSAFKTAGNYIQEVKARLTSPEYERFLACMKSFKDGTTKVEDVFTTMSGIFAAPERRYLLERFGCFLPSRYQKNFDEYMSANSGDCKECYSGFPLGSRKRQKP